MTKGLLLINLGTPDAANVSSVRRYLREFLSDKRVIDLPAPIRYLLLYGFILPIRTKNTTKAYQEIWTEHGSPLRYHSMQFSEALQAKLQNKYTVALGMRYGNPRLSDALDKLKSCDTITVLPLYPQYSSAATGSSIEYVLKHIESWSVFPSIHILRDFYQNPEFIRAQALQIKPYIDNHEHLLLSYHGLPERHLQPSGCLKPCENSCAISNHTSCYRAQCFQTSNFIARELELQSNFFSTSFQSRLGRTPWIKPYTDEILSNLAKLGIRRLAIACPSFVADCLETIEEIGIRAKEQWMQLGGECLTLIPCLNANTAWVDGVENIL